MPANTSSASSRPQLSPQQREEFLETGVLRLPGIIPRASAEVMADRVWADMARRHGLSRHRPQTWTLERPAGFVDLRKSGAFAEMASPAMAGVLDAFFGGAGWRRPAHWGQALVTFPGRGGDWTVPGASWHLDMTPGSAFAPWPDYVRVFTFLAPLEPGGGGTVYVSGSYRVVLQVMAEIARREVVRSATVREALKRESPWIADLCSQADDPGRMARLMGEGAVVEGVPLRVGEMTGDAGDVVLMHPATLHAGAPNCRRTPRMMLAESIYGERGA